MTRFSGKHRPNKKSGFKGANSVAETSRIRINQLLDQFRRSNDQVYTFEDNLNNHERATVHLLCKKQGLKSKSTGKGDKRRVSVTKYGKAKKDYPQDNDYPVTISDESRRVLTDLFVHYPPGDEEALKQNLKKPSGKSSKFWHHRDDIFCKPVMEKDQIVTQVESHALKVKKTPKLKEISDQRSKLPIASFQDAITSTISAHQVVLISGETGCGKTTQVPQYLLDYMWGKGETCKIVCTQPRRISAITVAERISQERGEIVGETVGYKIRMETKGGKHSSILFCTNGVLLRVLVSCGASGSKSKSSEASQRVISGFTHIIVDEIHERDRFSDFILAILRDLLPKYPHLRLVLMSATLDAERFSQYFGGCPIIRVPGFTHPVKSFYLEDILSILKTPGKDHLNASSSSSCQIEEINLTEESKVALDEAIEMALSNEEFDPLRELISSEASLEVLNYQHSSTGISPLMVFAGKGRVGDVCLLLSLGADCHLQARDGSNALNWAMREAQSDVVEILKKHMEVSSTCTIEELQLVEKYMSTINPDLIDCMLVEQLLRKICFESQDGAILVFLPGWEDINKIRERLLTSSYFQNSSKFMILPLHSMVPQMDQKKVFKRPPRGCRKIILSTNIAETSVTIDDVVYVIESGRMKEKSYDPYDNVSTLQTSWISQASAKQREGRAGRCQPGVCYHLYTKMRFLSFLEFQVPEIKRTPIEELCLQVKMLDPDCQVDVFLNKTLDPPVSETIKNALAVLHEIGAFTKDEKLTLLGEKLAALPVHPLVSKMLFFAILLNCLDPALTLACASDFRDPFTLPMLPNDKKIADEAKAKLASLYGGHSDQLAVIAAFEGWKEAKGRKQEARFCSEYFISSSTMNMLFGMRKQLQNELIKAGFIPDDISSCSLNAHDPGILRAVIVAGLYPKVGKFIIPRRGRRLTMETSNGERVCLNPRTMNSRIPLNMLVDTLPLLVYDEVTRGDGGLHTRNCTIISPLSLLLIATEIVVAPGNGNDNESGSDYGEAMEEVDKINKREDKIMSSPDNAVTIIVDRWISFGSTALDVAQLYCLRERLSAAILYKIANPSDVLPPVLGASVYATACLLAYDGLNGIPSTVESVDTLTSMVYNAEIGNSRTYQAPDSYLYSVINQGGPRPNPPPPNNNNINYNPRLIGLRGQTQTWPIHYNAPSYQSAPPLNNSKKKRKEKKKKKENNPTPKGLHDQTQTQTQTGPVQENAPSSQPAPIVVEPVRDNVPPSQSAPPLNNNKKKRKEKNKENNPGPKGSHDQTQTQTGPVQDNAPSSQPARMVVDSVRDNVPPSQSAPPPNNNNNPRSRGPHRTQTQTLSGPVQDNNTPSSQPAPMVVETERANVPPSQSAPPHNNNDNSNNNNNNNKPKSKRIRKTRPRTQTQPLPVQDNAPSSQPAPMDVEPVRADVPPSQSAPARQTHVPPLETPAQTMPQIQSGIGSESLAGNRSDTFGPYGPRGDSSKRPRG